MDIDPRFCLYRRISAGVLFVVMLLTSGLIPALIGGVLVLGTTWPWFLRLVLPKDWFRSNGEPPLWVTEFFPPVLMILVAFVLFIVGYVFLPLILSATAVIDLCRNSFAVRRAEQKVREHRMKSGEVYDAEVSEDKTQNSTNGTGNGES